MTTVMLKMTWRANLKQRNSTSIECRWKWKKMTDSKATVVKQR